MAEKIKGNYEYFCNTSSDINQHLPTLSKYSSECESVIELGVRGCVSSWAFANGLINNGSNTKVLFLNDITSCQITDLLNAVREANIKVDYEWINDLHLNIRQNYDLTFIDTWHVYGQLKRELDKYSKITNKYIAMHDTTVDAIQGETIRMRWNAEQQSIDSGFPIEEINRGLQKAIDEFLETNKNWVLHEKFENNNGLTILKRI